MLLVNEKLRLTLRAVSNVDPTCMLQVILMPKYCSSSGGKCCQPTHGFSWEEFGKQVA